MNIIDISRPVRENTPVWPGDEPFSLEWTTRLADGASVNLGAMHLSMHTGSHADAPFHARDDGERIGGLDLAPFIGPARVFEVRDASLLTAEIVGSLIDQAPCDRFLVRTGCWKTPTDFPTAFPVLEPEAVGVLLESGVRLFGTDAPSVDDFDSKDLPIHHALFDAGISVLESLDLDDVQPGHYELIALPLKLMDADGSPVRAILRTP